MLQKPDQCVCVVKLGIVEINGEVEMLPCEWLSSYVVGICFWGGWGLGKT